MPEEQRFSLLISILGQKNLSDRLARILLPLHHSSGASGRAALNSLAVVVPDWLRSHVPQEWYNRYEKRMEDFHFPKEATKFVPMIEQIGRDGFELLKWVRQADAPIWLREIPAVETLRLVWIQQFYQEEGKVHHRSNDNTPPASLLIVSPYDREARLGVKRDTEWTGYKVHLTETCDNDLPHLITNVERQILQHRIWR